jgi:hypothetical protein
MGELKDEMTAIIASIPVLAADRSRSSWTAPAIGHIGRTISRAVKSLRAGPRRGLRRSRGLEQQLREALMLLHRCPDLFVLVMQVRADSRGDPNRGIL